MFLKQQDIFNFNVDEIEIYGTFSNYETLLKGINDSNSDCITFGEFTLKKSDNLRDYLFKVDFWKNNFPCFAFYIGKKLNVKITTRDYFKVYGSAFTMIELSEIIDFINTYIDLDIVDKNKGTKANTIKRFDLAVDLKKNIKKDIRKNFSELKQIGRKYYGAKGELQSYYIGEYQIKFNKAFLIRIYNKIDDIKGKNKQVLYPSYLLEKDITRIEIEFRSQLTKFININKLLDRNYMFNLFIKYIEKHTKIFNKVKTQDVDKLKRLNKKINLEDLKHNQILKDKYLQAFLGYSKNILKIGSCPVDILLKNLLVSEMTLKDLALGIKDNNFSISEYIKGITIRNTKLLFADNYLNDED